MTHEPGVSARTTTPLPASTFAALVAQSQSAVCVTTADLDPPGPEIVYVNDAFTTLTGYDAESIVGRTPRLLQGPLTDRATLDDLRRRLEARETFSGEAVNYRADGTPFVIRWRVDPLVDESGRTTHFMAFQEDVTEIRHLQALRAALIAVEQSVVEAVDPTREQIGVAHVVNAAVAALADMLWSGRVTVLAAGHGMEHAASTDGKLTRSERNRLWRSLAGADGIRLRKNDRGAALYVPFRAGSVASGGVVIDELAPDALELIERDHLVEVVRGIQRGVAVVAARLREADEGLALQRVLLPHTAPSVAGFDIATRYVPSHRSARAGGDWYDAIERDGGCIVSIGDVAGKGLRAAGQMGLLRAHVRADIDAGFDIDEVVGRVHAFCREEEIVATCLFVDLDRAGAWKAVSAGHLPPIAASPEGARFLDVPPTSPVGAFVTRLEAKVATGVLPQGATLALYTDGLVDHRHQSIDAGLEDLLTAARGSLSPEDLCDRLHGQSDGGREDDVAVVAVQPAPPA